MDVEDPEAFVGRRMVAGVASRVGDFCNETIPVSLGLSGAQRFRLREQLNVPKSRPEAPHSSKPLSGFLIRWLQLPSELPGLLFALDDRWE